MVNEMAFDLFSTFATMVDPIFSPLLFFKPHVTLFLFAAILAIIVTMINKLMMNKKALKELKESLTNTRERLTKAQKEGKKDDINKLLNEYLLINNKYMAQTFKTVFVSFIVIIILFPWANHRFSEMTIISHPFTSMLSAMPLIKLLPNWLVWYILSSVSISWVLRKFVGE